MIKKVWNEATTKLTWQFLTLDPIAFRSAIRLKMYSVIFIAGHGLAIIVKQSSSNSWAYDTKVTVGQNIKD